MLLLLPAAREVPTREEISKLGKDWKIRPHFILSYEHLSRADYGATPGKGELETAEHWTTPLHRLAPQLIVADEAHKLKDPSGTRWKRINRLYKDSRGRYLPEAEQPLFVPMSGSFSSRSGNEYWHLIRRALRDGAPAPKDWAQAQEWWRALDSKTPVPLAPGALLDLAPALPTDTGTAHDVARARYGRRLTSTMGVVSSGGDMPDVELTIEVLNLAPSDAIARAAKLMRATWELPCGLPIDSAMDMWRHEQTLSCGLYQKWRVPAPREWLMARKGWSQYLREFLAESRTYETPKQVEGALESGRLKDAMGTHLLGEWTRVRDSFKPEPYPVWICDSTLRYAANWADKSKGIVWVHSSEFGLELSKMTKLPYFRQAGMDPETGMHIEKHRGPCIASIKSCGTGQNLQHHQQNLIVTSPTMGGEWEQLVSRTHRDGQKKPVYVGVLQRLEGDRKALDQARKDCQKAEKEFQAPQRFSVATWID